MIRNYVSYIVVIKKHSDMFIWISNSNDANMFLVSFLVLLFGSFVVVNALVKWHCWPCHHFDFIICKKPIPILLAWHNCIFGRLICFFSPIFIAYKICKISIFPSTFKISHKLIRSCLLLIFQSLFVVFWNFFNKCKTCILLCNLLRPFAVTSEHFSPLVRRMNIKHYR